MKWLFSALIIFPEVLLAAFSRRNSAFSETVLKMNLHQVLLLMESIPPLLSLSLLELPCLNSVHTCLSWRVFSSVGDMSSAMRGSWTTSKMKVESAGSWAIEQSGQRR